MLNFIKKQFASKEVNALLGVFDELDLEFNNHIFSKMKTGFQDAILKESSSLTEEIRNTDITAREKAYIMIANLSGDALESGHCHIYRGVLSMRGQEYFSIYKKAVKKLTLIGHLTEDEARDSLNDINKCIKTVG